MQQLVAALILYLTLCAMIHVTKPQLFFNKHGRLYGFGVNDSFNRVYSMNIVLIFLAIMVYYFVVVVGMSSQA